MDPVLKYTLGAFFLVMIAFGDDAARLSAIVVGGAILFFGIIGWAREHM